MRRLQYLTIPIVLVMLLSLATPSLVVSARPLAATAPPLGTAASFSVLAATAVTNVPTSVVSGDVGVFAGCAIDAGITTGGASHSCDAVAQGAVTDAGSADGDMLSQALTSNQGPALDGLTLVPGVYDIGAGQLNGGQLTLDGAGVYIFRASSSLVSSGTVTLINGARACDVYWHVASLATINGTSFVGTIIAGTGVHFGANVTLDGRAIAINGDVTLISNTITGPSCAASGAATSVPEAATSVPGAATSVPGAATGVSGAATGVSGAATLAPGGGGNSVIGSPSTGGAPLRSEQKSPWSPLLLGIFAVIALAMGILIHRRTHQPRE